LPCPPSPTTGVHDSQLSHSLPSSTGKGSFCPLRFAQAAGVTWGKNVLLQPPHPAQRKASHMEQITKKRVHNSLGKKRASVCGLPRRCALSSGQARSIGHADNRHRFEKGVCVDLCFHRTGLSATPSIYGTGYSSLKETEQCLSLYYRKTEQCLSMQERSAGSWMVPRRP